MKVLFLGLPLDLKSGVPRAQQLLAEALGKIEIEVEQLTTIDGKHFVFYSTSGEIKSFTCPSQFLTASTAEYDLVHCHSYIWAPGLEYPGVDVFRSVFQCPVVYTLHAQLSDRSGPEQERMLEAADLVLFLTAASQAEGLRLYPHITTAVVPNIATFEPLNETHWERAGVLRSKLGSGTNFLYVGRFSPEKGCISLVEAFILFAKANFQSKLILVGRDSLSRPGIGEQMKSVIERANLSERVIFTGELSREEIFLYQACAGAQIMPSLREGFPFAALEAIFMECPLILSNIPTLREIYWLDEAQKLAIPIQAPLGPTEILSAMNEFSNNQQYWKSRTAIAKASLLERYASESVAASLLSSYGSILREMPHEKS